MSLTLGNSEGLGYSLMWFSSLLAIFEKINGKRIANKYITR